MKTMIRTLIALALLAAGSAALHAQPAVKLVVVDMAKVFDSHYKSYSRCSRTRYCRRCDTSYHGASENYIDR